MRRISPLKLEIVRRGLVQADIARAAGIGESRLSRILNGRTEINDDEVKSLARVLGIPFREIRS